MQFRLENETLAYKDATVLDKISIQIQDGQKVALLGKSGSGKSTLLRHLFSLAHDKCSYIPQDLGLVETLSVFHNVYMAQLDQKSRLYNLRNLFFPAQKEIQEIKALLEPLQMDEMIFKVCGELSGGQMQRTAIARAVFGAHHDTLLADEPISALDEHLAFEALTLLKKHFTTIICALHNVPIALRFFDRIIGLKDDQIILDKACSDINEDDTQNLYYVCQR